MIVGIDLGGMSAKARLFGEEQSPKNIELNPLGEEVCAKTHARDSIDTTVETLSELAKEAVRRAGKRFEDVQAVGVGAPGIVDGMRGVVLSWSNFGWKNVPLGEKLSEKLKKPVFVLNDANAAALGEAKFGAGRDFSDSVLITLGTGVGGGIVLCGKLFEGYKGAGGEIGHTVIRMGGRKCACGRRGCLETYVSTKALIKDTVAAAKRDKKSALHGLLEEGRKADGFLLFEGLKRGDECAKQVFDRYIAALGEGILNLANLIRPQAVLIGGGISAQGETLLAPLRKYVGERLPAKGFAPLEILSATLGNAAGIYGAAYFALERTVLG